MIEPTSEHLPEIKLENGKLGRYELMYDEIFWFRLKDDDGYMLFEMTIPLISPLNEVQKELVLKLAIARFKLCEAQK